MKINTNSDLSLDLTELSDKQLMLEIREGKKQAMVEFVSRYLTQVVEFSRKYLGSQSDAENIAQEAFFRVWKHAPEWQTRNLPPRNWLYKVTYNLCVDQHLWRKPLTPINTQLDFHSEDNVTKNVHTREVKKHFSAALLSLSAKQRAAISLFNFRGFSNRDVAEIMGISVESLESLLSRGRRKLYEQLVDIEETLL